MDLVQLCSCDSDRLLDKTRLRAGVWGGLFVYGV